MDMQIMIKQMCKSEFNDSDLKAICKSRGFPADGATSREIFENFFISTMGIQEALNSLTYEEIVFLHLFPYLSISTIPFKANLCNTSKVASFSVSISL